MDQNEKIENALSDITLIKQTMGKSRVEFKRLSQLFFLFGILQFVLIAGRILLWAVDRSSVLYISTSSFLLLVQLSYFVIAVPYFIWRSILKKTENNYTLYLYDIWGYALFAVPCIWLLLTLTNLIFPQIISNSSYEAYIVLLWLAEQLSFFLGIAVTGFLLNSSDWKLLSSILFFSYFLSFFLFGRITEPLYELSAASLIGNHLASVQFVWSAVCPFVCMILGVYFWRRKR